MFSLEGQKSPQLIDQIKQLEGEPFVAPDVFNENEIHQILEIKEACYANPDFCQEKLLRGKKEPLGKMSHPPGEYKKALESIFRPKLKEFLSLDYEIDFSFHRNFFPYGIHTDSGYDPSEFIYKQGILPLETQPSNIDVYTVIFDQKSYHSAGYPRSTPEDMQIFREQNADYIIDFNHDVKKDISSEELKKYWTNDTVDAEWLKGFTIALPYKWQERTMAIWDRGHFHCSSDFAAHNVESKLGLMWVTKLKK